MTSKYTVDNIFDKNGKWEGVTINREENGQNTSWWLQMSVSQLNRLIVDLAIIHNERKPK